MTEVRKLSIDDQKKAIKRAFRDQIRIWHPDKIFGNDEFAKQIIVAMETLLDDKRRARYHKEADDERRARYHNEGDDERRRAQYHNEADDDNGWFSSKRFKDIFWSDCDTEEQNEAYWRRVNRQFAC